MAVVLNLEKYKDPLQKQIIAILSYLNISQIRKKKPQIKCMNLKSPG